MILPWVFICASLIVFFKYWEWELRHACVGWHYISGPHSQSFFFFLSFSLFIWKTGFHLLMPQVPLRSSVAQAPIEL